MFFLNCRQHGALRMPEALAGCGTKGFIATYFRSSKVRTYDKTDSATIYHHTVYRGNYYVYVDVGWHQDVDGYWSEERETVTISPRYGGIDLIKMSASPSITDGNGSYSTVGAVYDIYSNPQCTNWIDSMTTDSSGKATKWGFRAGSTVHVKEPKPSPSYNLDLKVYPVGTTADQRSYANGGIVHEPPLINVG